MSEREYVVTIRETFQSQVRVLGTSQADARRNAEDELRRYPPDPPNYGGDEDFPRSIKRSIVAAWEES